jgi:DNA-binding HxlR family transcriptional regulator
MGVTMNSKSENLCFCPLESFIGTIGTKWALLVINAIGIYGKLRFNMLMKELHGISPRTLSDRLKELQAEGLIKREFFAEIPPRVEYSLTEDGAELRDAVIPLLKWVIRRNVTSDRTVDCECDECKSRFTSGTTDHTKTPTNRP